jgi:hypothetical protein
MGEAAHHAVHLLNITLSRSLGNINSHEAAYGVVPDVSKLRVFGYVAFATLPHPKKLDDEAVRATNLTLGTESIVCCCRDPTTGYLSRPL